MKETTCGSCGAPIAFVLTEKNAKMPISLKTEQRRFIVDTLSDGTEVVRSRLTYESHFADCVSADAHRRAR